MLKKATEFMCNVDEVLSGCYVSKSSLGINGISRVVEAMMLSWRGTERDRNLRFRSSNSHLSKLNREYLYIERNLCIITNTIY